MISHVRIFQVVGRKIKDRSPPSINTDIRSPVFRTKYPRWMFAYHLRAFHANTNIINATRVLTKQHQLEAVYAVCQYGESISVPISISRRVCSTDCTWELTNLNNTLCLCKRAPRSYLARPTPYSSSVPCPRHRNTHFDSCLDSTTVLAEPYSIHPKTVRSCRLWRKQYHFLTTIATLFANAAHTIGSEITTAVANSTNNWAFLSFARSITRWRPTIAKKSSTTDREPHTQAD
jgi:hypothetical protein